MNKLTDNEVAYSVYRTNNYDLFHFIKSNRKVKQMHVERLITQIKEGYQLPPIIVNSEGAIIDGQHRFIALKKKALPIEFIIRDDVKENTLQRSNTLVSKWTTKDHINYQVSKENEDYIQLELFMGYSGLNASVAAKLLGKIDYSKSGGAKSLTQGIIEGRFKATKIDDAYQFVDEVLNEMRMENKNRRIINAVRNIYNLGVDNRLLVNVINALSEEIALITKETKITERLVNKYNQNCKKADRIKMTYDKQGYPVLKI